MQHVTTKWPKSGPHDGEVHELSGYVVAQLPGAGTFRAGVADSHWSCVDDGEGAGVGGTGDRQSDLRGPEDGIGHEVRTQAAQ